MYTNDIYHQLYISHQNVYKTFGCQPSIYVTYDTTKLNMTKKKHMMPLDDCARLLHQATDLMSKVHPDHRWMNVS